MKNFYRAHDINISIEKIFEMENLFNHRRRKKSRKFQRDTLPLRLNSINIHAIDTKDLPELLTRAAIYNAAACGINLSAKRTE